MLRGSFPCSNPLHACRPALAFVRHGRFDPDRTGWLALLSHWWERRFDVVNRGFSGYNTRWAMALLDRLFPHGEVVPVGLVTIFFGANDAVVPGAPQHGRLLGSGSGVRVTDLTRTLRVPAALPCNTRGGGDGRSEIAVQCVRFIRDYRCCRCRCHCCVAVAGSRL